MVKLRPRGWVTSLIAGLIFIIALPFVLLLMLFFDIDFENRRMK